LRSEENGGDLTYELDLTLAYPPDAGLQSFLRLFEWAYSDGDAGAKLVMTDTFAFAGSENKVEETFISLHAPDLGSGHIRWDGKNGAVTLRYDTDTFDIAHDVIPTEDHMKRHVTAHRIRLCANHAGAAASFRLEFVCS